MANEFKPTVGSEVPKKDALAWIEKYDKEIRKDKAKDPKSIFFGKDVIDHILRQKDCAGISFFFGLKFSEHAKKDTVHLVMVGTKEDGSLIWQNSEGKDGGDGGSGTYDTGLPCPPYCPSGGGGSGS
jgi:hypothetical protein